MIHPNERRRHLTCWCAGWILLALALLVGIPPAAAEEDTDPVISEGWERIGGFKGSTSSRLWQRVNDLLFEQEAEGSLYRDLGDVSLGLGYGTDEFEANWDNSFYRRLLPMHQEIPPGGVVTGEDLSRYMDLQTLISRGRMGYNFIPGFLDKMGGIGVRVEGGASLTLGRMHKPLEIDGLPMEEVLANPDRQLDSMARGKPEDGHRSLVRLGTEGIAGLVRWISRHLGDRIVDTEQSALFYEHYADTITLFIDLDIPVEAELFTAGDTRLGQGDMVRHVTFVGLVPLNVGLDKYGVKASYQRFHRFFRETTIVKEGGGQVLVQVRTALARGNELTPLKIRPEIRILGILKLGYTFYEQIYGNAHTTTYDVVYRLDLNDKRGMSGFEALLGDGTGVSIKPLAEAAVERDGAEILDTEARRGGERFSYGRTSFFSLYRRSDQRTASSDLVTTGDAVRREIVRVRNWGYKKRFGREQDRKKKFYIRAQSELHSLDDDGERLEDYDLERQEEEGIKAVTMLTGVRDDQAGGEQVRESATILSRALDWDSHPVLEELASLDPGLNTRYFLNLRLSLDGAHITRLAAATEDEVWTELAHAMLGPAHRDAWSSTEKRNTWRRDVKKNRRSADAPPLFDVFGMEGKSMSPRKRYRLARRSVKKFSKLQELAQNGRCLKCLTRSFSKWGDITLMQMLIIRLGRLDEEAEIGYHYEVFIDEMLRPVTVTNGIVYEYPSRLGIIDAMEAAMAGSRDRPEDSEHLEQEHNRGARHWKGDHFAEASRARLKGGDLLINTAVVAAPGAQSPPCWMLRVYSDLQFTEDLTLRTDLRKAGGVKADKSIGFTGFSLGEPTAVEQTPFITARYYYDIPLPAVESLKGGEAYVLLLRVINTEGLPVSEEQQVRFTWPEESLGMTAAGCFSPPWITERLRHRENLANER